MSAESASMACPCGSEKSYENCCQPYLQGELYPPTPQALMRSRYTAYTRADIEYIQRTMRGPALQGFNAESAGQWARQIQWLNLKIVDAPAVNDQTVRGYIEFMAFFSENGCRQVIHERSEFQKLEGRWYYFQGRTPKINRNDSCPCGSLKKFKYCCQR